MKKSISYTLLYSVSLMFVFTTLACSIPHLNLKKSARQQAVYSTMKKVSDYTLDNLELAPSYLQNSPQDWTKGAYYAGVWAMYESTQDSRSKEALLGLGAKTQWKVGKFPLFADDQAIAYTYLNIYQNLNHDSKIVNNIFLVFNQLMKTNPILPLKDHLKVQRKGAWSWCDALFMAPPVWAKAYEVTGDRRYLDFMDKKYQRSCDFLFDKDEKLFYRDARYFNQHEQNGKKVFWSRGNGWVLAGLCQMFKSIPKEDVIRAKYESLFKTLALRIIELQGEDGLWRTSLLNPTSTNHGEISGSAFFCYALAYGINHQILDKKIFLKPTFKAWNGLNRAVNEDGRLGYIQLIGEKPENIKSTDFELYGVGAFLLAGSEMAKLVEEQE